MSADPLDPETGKLIAEKALAIVREQNPDCWVCGEVADGLCSECGERVGEVEVALTDLCREVRKGADGFENFLDRTAGERLIGAEREVSDLRERLATAERERDEARRLSQHYCLAFGSEQQAHGNTKAETVIAQSQAADLRERGAKLAEALRAAPCRCVKVEGSVLYRCDRCAALSSWDGPEIKEG